MPLQKYAHECMHLSRELTSSLDGDLFEETLGRIREMDYSDWMKFREVHQREIEAVVAATPAQRERKLKPKHGPELWPLLVMAACQHCVAGYELLDVVSRRCQVGQSYRSMAAEAGSARIELDLCVLSLWPWVPPSFHSIRETRKPGEPGE